MYLIHSEGDFVPMQHSLDLEEAEEVGHYMPTDGVTDETVADSRAHGGALFGIPRHAGQDPRVDRGRPLTSRRTRPQHRRPI
ncbi:hypothetical protein ACFYO9_12050 [Streptomyces sp. NPDC005863]|uniref:hypothetical protein n=1 Tax=unclassified Streptomyces TaxID=2593676 RepID=UPI0033C998D8